MLFIIHKNIRRITTVVFFEMIHKRVTCLKTSLYLVSVGDVLVLARHLKDTVNET